MDEAKEPHGDQAPGTAARTITQRAQSSLAEHYRMCVDAVSVTPDLSEVHGWALTPTDTGCAHVFRVNGDTVADFTCRMPSADVGRAFPLVAGAEACRFVARMPLAGRSAYRDGFLALEYCPDGRPDLQTERTTWYWPDPAREIGPVPAGANIERVIGTQNAYAYRLGGATIVNRVDRYLRRLTGRGLGNIGRILDWGCGCARLTRYVRGCFTADVTGIDIDPVNVDWCHANLPSLDIRLVGLMPPTPFEAGTFSLVVGLSVMTHLREAVQDAWLAELARILRPGGLAVLSVMGERVQVWNGMPEARLRQVVEAGFYLTDELNTQIDAGRDGTSPAYYVNVVHTPGYVFERWQRDFDLVDFLPGMAAPQDFVVLRRR